MTIFDYIKKTTGNFHFKCRNYSNTNIQAIGQYTRKIVWYDKHAHAYIEKMTLFTLQKQKKQIFQKTSRYKIGI